MLSANEAFISQSSREITENSADEIGSQQFDLAGTASDYTQVYVERAAEGVIKVMGLLDFTAADYILERKTPQSTLKCPPQNQNACARPLQFSMCL